METCFTKKEHELVLNLCRFLGPNKERIAELAGSGPDWAYVLGQLLYNRMGGAAHAVFREAGFPGRPSREFRGALKTVHDDNKRRGAAYAEALESLATILKNADFPYAALKGAVLCGLYPEGIRTSNDVDLLVDGKDIGNISALLAANGFLRGYVRNGEFIESTRSEIVSARLNRGETIPFVRKNSSPAMPYIEVDVNFSLDFKARQESGCVSDLLRSTVANGGNPGGLRTLPPERFLIHLCAHLYKEASIKSWVDMGRDQALYKYADIYLMLRRAEIDHADLLGAIKKYGQEKPCYYAFKSAQALFGIKDARLDSLLGDIEPVDLGFLCEVRDPSGGGVFRHDCYVTDWVFHPNRKEELYEALDLPCCETPRTPGETHFLKRFNQIV